MSTSANRSGARAQDEGTLQESLSAVSEAAKAAASDVVERGRAVASDMVDRGRAAASDMVDRGRESVDRAREGLSDRVRDRPLTSVLVAGGIGLLVGMLIARRRGE
ncbi:MAG TPA: DUF883 C-terminal domain-containing protein [Planctomycetota bacterium]|nr:DUF883 C-terminal domain-containing protein [Planctomycetota bacterium]